MKKTLGFLNSNSNLPDIDSDVNSIRRKNKRTGVERSMISDRRGNTLSQSEYPSGMRQLNAYANVNYNNISERRRYVRELYVIDHKTQDEIAFILNISQTTVHNDLKAMGLI